VCVCVEILGGYSLLHLESHSILISNLSLVGLFSLERGKRDLYLYKCIHMNKARISARADFFLIAYVCISSVA